MNPDNSTGLVLWAADRTFFIRGLALRRNRWRPLWPFDEVMIGLRQLETKAQILSHSPAGKVPALKHDDLLVWESLAICEYIAESFPEAGLLPSDARARAVARSVTRIGAAKSAS